MLLDEDPATLIHHTISNFNIQPDKAALSRISSSLSTLEESRSLRLRDSETALRKLTRQLNTLQSQHKEAVVAHDGGSQHAAEIVDLDTRKFRVAKQVRDAEEESERLEGELERLRGELERVEGEGVEGGEAVRRSRGVDDPTILRLWLYRSLGITLEQDEAGNYNKATIANTKKGDVHVLNMDPKFSKYFYADYFWEHMQG